MAPPSTTPPRRSRRADFVQAAAELFADRGYAGTSVDDVGNRLGVSGPAVYWHFESKEALLTTMLADSGVRPDASINVTRPAPATQPTLHNPWKLDIIARPVVRSTRIA